MDLARAPRRRPLTARKKGSGYENGYENDFESSCIVTNLVPRACDPREGNEGSGIIRFREDSDWPLKWMRSSILATIPGFRQRIIPEPSFPSQGSQARGTRLHRYVITRSRKLARVITSKSVVKNSMLPTAAKILTRTICCISKWL